MNEYNAEEVERVLRVEIEHQFEEDSVSIARSIRDPAEFSLQARDGGLPIHVRWDGSDPVTWARRVAADVAKNTAFAKHVAR